MSWTDKLIRYAGLSTDRPKDGIYDYALRYSHLDPQSTSNPVKQGTLEFACRTSVDMRRCIVAAPSISAARGGTARAHSYPPPPASASNIVPNIDTDTSGGSAKHARGSNLSRSNTSDSSLSSSSTAVSLSSSRPSLSHGDAPLTGSTQNQNTPLILVSPPQTSPTEEKPGSSITSTLEIAHSNPNTDSNPEQSNNVGKPPQQKTEITNFILTPRPHLSPSSIPGSLSSSSSGVFSVLPNTPSFLASAIQSILPPRQSFTLHTRSLPPIVTFHDTSPYFGTQTRGTILFDTGVARVLGIDESFWIAVACAYLEYLGERESYMAAADG